MASSCSCNDEKKIINSTNISQLYYTDLFPINENGNKPTKEFLLKVIEICLDFIQKSNDRSTKVIDFHTPEELQKLFDFSIPDEPLNIGQILNDCRDALKYQVKTAHPHFFNQLSCGLDIVSLAGEWLTAAANTNMFTYEIAPVFILMEHHILKKMRDIIGFTNGDSILCPGGAISNLYAVIIARHKLFAEYKAKGLKALSQQLVLFTSEHSHYSTRSAGAVCGFGTDNVIDVPCDERGRMIPSELERLVKETISRGDRPFFINCTSGTTVLGAFDQINPLADIADKYNIWLHVDAAWGGGCLLSRKHRHKLDGIERARSVTWNPHKLMSTLLQCSTVHFKENGLLMDANQMCADYLFQQDKHYDVSYDTGDKVIQCGRHNDIFKLWIMWRSKGMEGYERHIDHLFDLTDYMVEKLKDRPDQFYLIIPEPECVNISFWYIPTRLRNVPHDRQRIQELGTITPQLKARMMNSGTLMIGYQPVGEIPNFFRNIISNSGVQTKDIDFLLSELDRLGHDL
ncbi:glutamate decarboxylase-like [Oppia nitens]|uniref:glutamate decarboxylase-like n=1 Tax=Oppia nitens TaxID=1686743 RepID=UPI0023D9911F|nr:glutamate decarboxylase-like [Oppia nitens]XP_054162482.1 glutamate decarboxylase-like [Oppia nitens]